MEVMGSLDVGGVDALGDRPCRLVVVVVVVVVVAPAPLVPHPPHPTTTPSFLQALHGQKVKILMKSINGLKEEILALKGQQSSNRQTKIINSMRQKLREQELVGDVLKEELQNRGVMTIQEANELVIRKTLG